MFLEPACLWENGCSLKVETKATSGRDAYMLFETNQYPNPARLQVVPCIHYIYSNMNSRPQENAGTQYHTGYGIGVYSNDYDACYILDYMKANLSATASILFYE